MSHIGFLCDATDLPVDIDTCLACARSGSLPGCHQTAPVIAGIVRGLRPADFGWTMTTLIGCVRKARLMRTEPYWLKPAQVVLGVQRATAARRRRVVCDRNRSRTRGAAPGDHR